MTNCKDGLPKTGEVEDAVPHLLLIGGLEHEFGFSIQLGIIIPIDFHMFRMS